MPTQQKRCFWVNLDNQLYIDYHDHEWGVPIYDDQKLFEMIILEGAQAGLSWETVLKKRKAYQKHFLNFDAHKISKFTQKDIDKLCQNPEIIRNRLKIESTISNAKAFLKIKETESFSDFLWQFVDGKPIKNSWRQRGQVPAFTKESDLMSKELKKKGFRFVGSTICYAFMQAVGMVSDHTIDCFRYTKVNGKK
ncbi:MAG: DNA-3-methyladenine glycosylase I [Alphaproteobacteria bacterium]|nr:DNA-3-methyladenine glycosylase I [Alphaproteobacteria bacterium]